MTLVKGIFRVLFLLLIQSAIWSICVCKPIKKKELSPEDDDLFGLFFSQKPFWPPTLQPPLVRPTISWEHGSHSLHDRKYTNASERPEGLRVLIFIVVGIVGFLIVGLVAILCKYYVCESDARSNSTESSNLIHPPPERIQATNLDRNSPQIQYSVMPTYAGASTILNLNPPQNLNRLRPIYAGASTTNLDSNTQQFQNGTVSIVSRTSNTYDIIDKPPSYSDVVTSDLIGESLRFPDVSVTSRHHQNINLQAKD